MTAHQNLVKALYVIYQAILGTCTQMKSKSAEKAKNNVSFVVVSDNVQRFLVLRYSDMDISRGLAQELKSYSLYGANTR